MVKHPGLGGVYAYTKSAFGHGHAFLSAWFLCLSYLALIPQNATALAGRRLLLVEDNEINREIAVMILTQTGFIVETAKNGKIAVDMVSASDPGYYDAVLMDIQMPVMNGYEATGAIRALENRELASGPIVAMTANAFKEDEQAAADAGMQAHIAKPLDIDKMIQTLSGVLHGAGGK